MLYPLEGGDAPFRRVRGQRKDHIGDFHPAGPQAVDDVRILRRGIQTIRPSLRKKTSHHFEFELKADCIPAIGLVISAFHGIAGATSENGNTRRDRLVVQHQHIHAAEGAGVIPGEGLDGELPCIFCASERRALAALPTARLDLEESRNRAVKPGAMLVTFVRDLSQFL